MSNEVIHGGCGHALAEKSKPVEYGKALDQQTTVYTYTNTPEPPPVKPAPNPRHLSKEDGHRTPPDIVDRARLVLGGVDLDPFSSAEANAVVGAREFFSGPNVDSGQGPSPLDAVDGFYERWRGRVFCNPPGGRGPKNESNQKRAWFKLAEEYDQDRVTSGLFVCFSVELLQTTQVKTPGTLRIPLDFPICYPSRRVAYLTPDGKKSKSPPHSSCLILLPERLTGPRGMWDPRQIEKFVEVFSDLGRVVVPWCARSL